VMCVVILTLMGAAEIAGLENDGPNR